jgi:hypothetical protein
MTKFSRIPVGNGSYCYSGPNCSLHGAKPTVNLDETKDQTALRHIQDSIRDNIEDAQKTEQKFLCKSDQNAEDMQEIYQGLVHSRRSARWCPEHKTNHIYTIRTFAHQMKSTNSKNLNILVLNTLKSLNVDLKGMSVMLEYARNYEQTLRTQSMKHDQENLRSIDPEFYDKVTGYHNLMKQTMKNGEVFRSDKDKYDKPLMLSQEKISDEQMLHYWQCGRKVKHPTFEKAETHQIMVNDTGMGAYKCPHCGNYHNGHGDGQTKREVQIEKAREHWTENPEKANSYIETMKLA